MVAIWRKEAAKSQAGAYQETAFPRTNPTIRHGANRQGQTRAAIQTDVRVQDDDLPPITVMTGAAWADKEQAVTTPVEPDRDHRSAGRR